MNTHCLCMLFCATSGLNGENLGSDEQEIIVFDGLIFDIPKAKVIGVQRQYVKPRISDVKFDFLSNECKLETDINESVLKNAKYLENVIDELDNYLRSRNIHPEYNGNKFTLVTDGSLHLRQCLIPECTKKGIQLPSYYYSYFDIRKEFCKFYGKDKVANLNQILNDLTLTPSNDVDYGMRQCSNMEKIVMKMINDGHSFNEPEPIMQVLDQGIWYISADDDIEDNTVVRARGLPWQCTDLDVAKFFRGLNIEKAGIALCLSTQGRRNGEALVRFISEEHRDLALRRHKHHIGQRYIEVYRASGKEFLSVAGGSNSEAQSFLSRNGKVIVRMRGLPFDATAKDVTNFFENGDNSIQIVDNDNGVLFVHYPDGRSTGDAFVMFKTEDEAVRALQKHKDVMGTRYIELFRSTTAEVQQVFKRSQDPKHYQNSLKDLPFAPLPLLPPELLSGGNKRDCIRLRNMPVECGVEHILEFLGVHSQHIVQQGVHMIFNSHGLPSGEAFIQMDNEQSAAHTTHHKNNKYIFFNSKKYYIEVIQCSGEEMNLVLMGVVPSNLLNGHSNNFLPPPPPPPLNNSISILPSPTSGIIPNAINSTSTASNVYPQSMNTSSSHIPITAPITQINGAIPSTPQMAHHHPNHPASQYYPQILYWYPTPPVSPSSAIYLHPTSMLHSPSIIILRGVPLAANVQDILNFLSGFPELSADCIQIQRTPDGRPTGDVLVTFFNRSEAERAVYEKNHQILGNRIIELYLAV